MAELLVIKERIKNFYQKYSPIVNHLIKCVTAIIVFLSINAEFGSDQSLTTPLVFSALVLVSTFTPSIVLILLSALLLLLHIKNISFVLAASMAVVILIMYLVFIRFAPKYAAAMIAFPILFMLRIPYVLPLLFGMFGSMVAIIPIAMGVLLYYILFAVQEIIIENTNTTAGDTLELYNNVVREVSGNRFMWYSMIILILVFITVQLMKKQKIKYSFDIAICSGALVNMLGFLIGDFILDVPERIVQMLLGTLASAVLVWIIQFFRLTLDYSVVENYQFEDDEYYYYVKAVPKMNVTVPKKEVQHINVQTENENTVNLKETFEKIDKMEKLRDSEEESIPEIDADFDFENDFVVEIDEKDFEE